MPGNYLCVSAEGLKYKEIYDKNWLHLAASHQNGYFVLNYSAWHWWYTWCLIYYQWSLYKWKCAKLLFISLEQTPVLPFKWPLLISIIQDPTNKSNNSKLLHNSRGYHSVFLVYDTCGLSTAQHVYREVVTLIATPLPFHMCIRMCGMPKKEVKHFLGKTFLWDFLQMSFYVIFMKSLLGRYYIPH